MKSGVSPEARKLIEDQINHLEEIAKKKGIEADEYKRLEEWREILRFISADPIDHPIDRYTIYDRIIDGLRSTGKPVIYRDMLNRLAKVGLEKGSVRNAVRVMRDEGKILVSYKTSGRLYAISLPEWKTPPPKPEPPKKLHRPR
jgi:hypothetical protein